MKPWSGPQAAWRELSFFPPVALHFVDMLARHAGADPAPEVLLAAALLVRAAESKEVCLDLGEVAGRALAELDGREEPPALEAARLRELRTPALEPWLAALEASPLEPLVLDGRRLYLRRSWEEERDLARRLLERASRTVEAKDPARLESAIARIFGDSPDQAAAARAAAGRRLCVVVGGPGTGKTFSVLGLLALLVELEGRPLEIALAAPTGKAAARIGESIRRAKELLRDRSGALDAIPERASTLHRLLGFGPGSRGFRYGPDEPLAADVVVVDEASMVDLPLMARLLAALPDEARLILMGDPDQLASVEAGSVLADMAGAGAAAGGTKGGWGEAIVRLTRSRRNEEPIARLAEAIREGDAGRAPVEPLDPARVLERAFQGYAGYLDAIAAGLPRGPSGISPGLEALHAAFEAFDRFRVLCALRRGPLGAESIGRAIEQALARAGRIAPGARWYPGRPVMVLANDYGLGLFNGDVGICWLGASPSTLRVYFPAADGGGGFRAVSPLRLPPHETAWAMTVHKSQGSEFDRVLVVLPPAAGPVLTRELLYTAVTRARKGVELAGEKAVLAEGIRARVRRAGGLAESLWNAGP